MWFSKHAEHIFVNSDSDSDNDCDIDSDSDSDSDSDTRTQGHKDKRTQTHIKQSPGLLGICLSRSQLAIVYYQNTGIHVGRGIHFIK